MGMLSVMGSWDGNMMRYDAVVTSWALCLVSLGMALAENLPNKVVKTSEVR